MMKKVVAMMLALTLSAGMLAGCSSGETPAETPAATDDAAAEDTADDAAAEDAAEDTAAADSDLLVYGIYKAGDQTWFLDEGDAAKAAVEAAGGEFVYVDAKMNPEEYLKAIDNAIANNASGIVTCTPDQTMSQAVVTKCEEAGIPVDRLDPLQSAGDAQPIHGVGQTAGIQLPELLHPRVGYDWLHRFASFLMFHQSILVN